MCRFIAEGIAVAEAERRYGRIFQIGTYGRFGANQKIRKIFESGLLKQCDTVLVEHGGVKVKEWSGMVKYKVEPRPRQPRLGHVLRPGAPAALPAPSLRRHAPRLLGLRGRRTVGHGPPPPRRAGLPVRPRRHLAGRNHSLRPAAPSRVLHGLGLGGNEVCRRLHARLRERRMGAGLRPPAIEERRRERTPQDAQRRRPEEARRPARPPAAGRLRRSRQDPQAGGRKRRGLACAWPRSTTS